MENLAIIELNKWMIKQLQYEATQAKRLSKFQEKES